MATRPPTESATDRLLDALERHGAKVTRRADQASAQCPAHDDSSPSLSIRAVRGQALIYCHAGCQAEDVMNAVGLELRDLYDEPKSSWPYRDENGRLERTVHRQRGKKFPQSGPKRSPILYKLRDVLAAVAAGERIVLVEGEKDADAVHAVGAVGTTAPMGSQNFHKVDVTPLQGAHVVAVVDRDTAGDAWAVQVRDLVGGIAAALVFKQAAVGKDTADHLAAGRTLGELVDYVFPALSSPDITATAQPPLEQPELAADRNILDRFEEAVIAQGLVGESILAKLLFLTLTSRLLDRQVSAGVKGHSASGKSWTVEVVLRFFPRDSYLTFTAMSEKALVYSDEEYAHRTLVIYEVVALREGIEDDLTSYLIRSLLSEGRLEYPVTVRDPKGGFTTKTIVKEGPTNLIFTTTKTQVHAENETRILSLNTDDSNEQTARIFLELANDDPPAREHLREWVDLQRWLEDQDNRVAIPYAKELAALIPAVAVRLRRDVGALLSLIRAHAVLHQATRGRDADDRIVATLDDYAIVRALVADILAEGVGATVSATVRATVAAVAKATTGAVEASALQVAQHLDVDKSNAGRRLRAAADGGYVRNREDRRGKPGRWVLGDPLPDSVALLPAVEALSGCAVAAGSGEEKASEETE